MSYQSDHHSSNSYDYYSSTPHGSSDEDTFLELQKYADFQDVLSHNITADIATSEVTSPYSSYSSNYLYPSNTNSGLPYSIIIPKLGNGWGRVFPSSLQQLGIQEWEFLQFVDVINSETGRGVERAIEDANGALFGPRDLMARLEVMEGGEEAGSSSSSRRKSSKRHSDSRRSSRRGGSSRSSNQKVCLVITNVS